MKPGQAYQERSIELIKFCRVLLEEFSSDKLRRSHDRGTDRDWCAVLKTEQALESAKAAKDRHTHSANEAFIAAQGACEKTFLDATELRIFQKAMQEAKDKDDDYMRTRTESFAILRVFKKKRKAPPIPVFIRLRCDSLTAVEQRNYEHMKFRLDETLNMVLLTLLQEMDHTLKLHQNLHFYGAGSQPGSPAAPLKWDTTLESLFFRGKTSVHRQCVLSLYADRNAYIFHDQIRVYGNIGENNRDVWLKDRRGIVKTHSGEEPLHGKIKKEGTPVDHIRTYEQFARNVLMPVNRECDYYIQSSVRVQP